MASQAAEAEPRLLEEVAMLQLKQYNELQAVKLRHEEDMALLKTELVKASRKAHFVVQWACVQIRKKRALASAAAPTEGADQLENKTEETLLHAAEVGVAAPSRPGFLERPVGPGASDDARGDAAPAAARAAQAPPALESLVSSV